MKPSQLEISRYYNRGRNAIGVAQPRGVEDVVDRSLGPGKSVIRPPKRCVLRPSGSTARSGAGRLALHSGLVENGAEKTSLISLTSEARRTRPHMVSILLLNGELSGWTRQGGHDSLPQNE
jgi:hypothetical protein